jgi:hypothetical protein
VKRTNEKAGEGERRTKEDSLNKGGLNSFSSISFLNCMRYVASNRAVNYLGKTVVAHFKALWQTVWKYWEKCRHLGWELNRSSLMSNGKVLTTRPWFLSLGFRGWSSTSAFGDEPRRMLKVFQSFSKHWKLPSLGSVCIGQPASHSTNQKPNWGRTLARSHSCVRNACLELKNSVL